MCFADYKSNKGKLVEIVSANSPITVALLGFGTIQATVWTYAAAVGFARPSFDGTKDYLFLIPFQSRPTGDTTWFGIYAKTDKGFQQLVSYIDGGMDDNLGILEDSQGFLNYGYAHSCSGSASTCTDYTRYNPATGSKTVVYTSGQPMLGAPVNYAQVMFDNCTGSPIFDLQQNMGSYWITRVATYPMPTPSLVFAPPVDLGSGQIFFTGLDSPGNAAGINMALMSVSYSLNSYAAIAIWDG